MTVLADHFEWDAPAIAKQLNGNKLLKTAYRLY